ncbi:MAG: hypothetical protein Q9227_003407 [Pyrenula ochraceoflavens]
MASTNPPSVPVTPDTLITVKVLLDSSNRRFKLPLRDLSANSLPSKLRTLLNIPSNVDVRFERFSDSAASYVTLDSSNPAIYKSLYRAAKAKFKLRIKATIIEPSKPTAQDGDKQSTSNEQPKNSEAPADTRRNYLETVLGPNADQPDKENLSVKSNASTLTPETFITGPRVKIASLPVPRGPPVHTLSRPTLPNFHDFPTANYYIDCNNCGNGIKNEHYHCSICDNGDYDLCLECVENDIVCEGEGHWLIKRCLKDGKLINSTTERIAPKKEETDNKAIEQEELKSSPPACEHSDRTCNGCIGEFGTDMLATCLDCPDVDLCYPCLYMASHGHDPAHQFKPLSVMNNDFATNVADICRPGRGVPHAAVCDGCDKGIRGVRHKCLTCPDWDFCADCISKAPKIHPGHRFATLYKPISDPVSGPSQIHHGIFCDGPLCQRQSRKTYIQGDRYKCAVCHDTDFCANCEAHPSNRHNRTHPLIKFKTPVRNVSVTTLGERGNGERMAPMGDKPVAKNVATETASVDSANASTQVQTPEVKHSPETVVQKPIESFFKKSPTPPELNALFVSDTVSDGLQVNPETIIHQTWKLYNPGPSTWPVGCSVRFIGGDDMFNVSQEHPSSLDTLTAAMETNVLRSEIVPGKSAEFSVQLKTPKRQGKAISYWRLKTPEGLPFGHKLWCDVDVKAAPSLKNEPVSPTAAVAETAKSASKSAESSTMIFPKLEKESPASSTHNVAVTVEAETATEPPVPKFEEQELADDIESLELDEDDTEDGFLTDEEYDILDASDEDFLIAEAEKAAGKK